MKHLLDTNSIIEYLKANISEKRFTHSINVSSTAERLAVLYGCDSEKACIAGLVHDCARELGTEQLLSSIEEEGIIVDENTIGIKELLHGPAAVNICRRIFRIQDEEILNAVRYHTTGRENMTLLEKIIYLSDFIEPGRDFPGVGELRILAGENLDKALLMAFNSSIMYLVSKNGIIHTDTIISRNYILEEVMKR